MFVINTLCHRIEGAWSKVEQILILDSKFGVIAAVHLGSWKIHKYREGNVAWRNCRVVVRKLTTFVMGRGKLDTMVNDCDGSE